MPALQRRDHVTIDEPRPWTLEGDVDVDYEDEVRARLHAALTDPRLTQRFHRRYPLSRRAEYHEMIAALGYVWACRYDGTVNVTGYCCAACGRTSAHAAS